MPLRVDTKKVPSTWEKPSSSDSTWSSGLATACGVVRASGLESFLGRGGGREGGGFRVWGLGFRVWGLGFSGFRVCRGFN